MVTYNAEFAKRVSPGDVVVMPRPSEGVFWIGMISRAFELVDDPVEWADEYIQLRKDQKLCSVPRVDHVADVVQSWKVECWRSVPVPAVPRWISYVMFLRHSIGWLPNHPDYPDGGPSAASVLLPMLDGDYSLNLALTTDPSKVEKRLLNWVSPLAFEHLVCDLLQLEYPEMQWWHIGGSGDGGVDGIEMKDGNVVAGVQCK
jgi:hypothetical protein